MSRHLPPFPAVRAFEAAARNLSFKRAAEELHLSQSAISHQIKNLENYLDAQLFRRSSHGIALTTIGSEYLAAVSHALDSLDAATDCAGRAARNGPLRVQTTPAFAARWLIPRLCHFSRRHPDIELSISTSIEPPNFEADEVDFLVQYGMAPASGVIVEALLSSARSPVCSPQLLRNGMPLRAPDDLRHHTLLYDKVGDGWAEWFRCASADPASLGKGPTFAHCDLSLRAAERGQGIALGYIALLEHELASGALVKPFEIETQPKAIYSMAFPERRANHRKIAALRAWLLEQVAPLLHALVQPPLRRAAV
jgi:LysR family glycine cleavage system transcriptional activator